MTKDFDNQKADEALSLREVQIAELCLYKEKARARRLLAKHHYLGDVRAAGRKNATSLSAGLTLTGKAKLHARNEQTIICVDLTKP